MLGSARANGPNLKRDRNLDKVFAMSYPFSVQGATTKKNWHNVYFSLKGSLTKM